MNAQFISPQTAPSQRLTLRHSVISSRPSLAVVDLPRQHGETTETPTGDGTPASIAASSVIAPMQRSPPRTGPDPAVGAPSAGIDDGTQQPDGAAAEGLHHGRVHPVTGIGAAQPGQDADTRFGDEDLQVGGA